MPLGTTLENRRRASRDHHMTPHLIQMNIGMPSEKPSENRRQASRRQKTPHLAEVYLWMPLDKTLEKHRASRRLTSQRKLRNVNEAIRSLETTCYTILTNRRRASRCIQKIGNIAEVSLGIRTTLWPNDAERSDENCHEAERRETDNG
jgi:hypothetical protein